MVELNLKSLTSFTALTTTVLLASVSFAEAGHGDQKQIHEESESHGVEDTVALSDDVIEEFGIIVGVAGPGVVTRTVSLPAEIRANEDRLAHIAPRFPGIAREVRKSVGDSVKAGETLAIIESSESLAPYPLKAQIDGTVIERHITRGEPVSQSRGRAFTVADLREVWVDISVYQKHLTSVQLGQTVRISAGHGLAEAEGTISYVSPIVDEDTRTATARIVLANPEGLWRPGLFVTAVVELERVEAAVAVPRTALEQVEGSTVVFVRGQDGFAPRPVTFGLQGRDLVEVTTGLEAGVSYVTQGGFTLKSELAGEELGGGHGH
jgi:cobalt-zinc-cadmium efflux system membrane fusion protein